eukprot:g5276.t1
MASLRFLAFAALMGLCAAKLRVCNVPDAKACTALQRCGQNGDCQDRANQCGYGCQCHAGWEGEQCETNVDECAPGPCHNDGTCTDLINDYKCTCPTNTYAKDCLDCPDGHECDGSIDATKCANNHHASGGDIASVKSRSDLDAIQDLYKGSLWIGIEDQNHEGTWRNADGSSPYLRWGAGEPNNSGNEDCVHLRGDYYYNDHRCNDYHTYFACEYDVPRVNKCTACPRGHTCDGHAKTPCATTKYVTNNVCTACPDGYECDGHAKTKLTCAALAVASGSVTYSDPSGSTFGPRQEKSVAKISCNEGFTQSQSGVDELSCSTGSWIQAHQIESQYFMDNQRHAWTWYQDRCENMGADWRLCTREEYCPGVTLDNLKTNTNHEPIYGITDRCDNWAPIYSHDGGSSHRDWITVGCKGDRRNCQTHVESHNWPAQNTWGDSGHNHNEVALCCKGAMPAEINGKEGQRNYLHGQRRLGANTAPALPTCTCASDRYVSNGKCLACPTNWVCNGATKTKEACAADYCNHRGVIGGNKVDGCTCACSHGWEGDRCEASVNDCHLADKSDSNPCNNGGTCTDLHNDYKCNCPTHTSGTDCEVKAACDSNYCNGHGSVSGNKFDNCQCTCNNGREGATCDTKTVYTALSQLTPSIDLDANAADPYKDQVTGATYHGHGFTALTTHKGFKALNLEYMERTSTGSPKIPDKYTQAHWVSWRISDSGWRTLFRPSSDHGIIVQSGTKDLGMYSNRNGAFRNSGYDIKADGSWQLIVVTGEASSPGSSVGTSKFYKASCVNCDNPSFTYLGSADRVVSGTTHYRVGWGGQSPGYVARSMQFDHVLNNDEMVGMFAATRPACASDYCKNGGTVSGNLVDGCTCACASGWEGATCQASVNDCAPNPCKNGGACTDGHESYTCTCEAHTSGTNCETKAACDSNYCNDRGTVGGNKYDGCTCSDCTGNYEGDRCNDKKACASDHCKNQGTLGGNLVDGCTCACTHGWTGATCQASVNDCAPNPCNNGGTCTDGHNDYTCTCPAHTSGDDCETKAACDSNYCNGKEVPTGNKFDESCSCPDKCGAATDNSAEGTRSYSSIWDNNAKGTGHAASKLDSSQGWSGSGNLANSWMQLDLGSVKTVSGIVVQKRKCGSECQYVKTVTVQVSKDATCWTDVDNGATFTANSYGETQDHKRYVSFAAAYSARYVRVTVKTYYGHMSMRLGAMIGQNGGSTCAEQSLTQACACATTKYVANYVCTNCPSGHTCNGVTKTACATTKYVTNNVCTNCPSGHTCNGTSKTACATTKYVTNNVCTNCPSGHTCNGAIATSVFTFVQQSKTYNNAKAYCEGLGQELASIKNQAELNTVQALYNGNLWIGINDKNMEGQWLNEDGTKPFLAWGTGEPNDSSGEDCVHLRGDHLYNDHKCDGYNAYFVCRAKPACVNQKVYWTELVHMANGDNPGDLEKVANGNGWNGVAVSGQRTDGKVKVSFTGGNNNYHLIGLSTNSNDHNLGNSGWRDLECGMYIPLTNTHIHFYEDGSHKGSYNAGASPTGTDVFKIIRDENDIVKYYKNNVHVGTCNSGNAVSGTAYIDVAVYNQADSLEAVNWDTC